MRDRSEEEYMLSHYRKEELGRLVSESIEKEYGELCRLNDFPKNHMWINHFWIGFAKDSIVKKVEKAPTIQTTVQPVIKYVPNPDSRIKYENMEFPSRLFESKNFESALCDLDDENKRRMLVNLPELIVTSLESSRMEIPSKSEINENINNNIDGFLAYVKHKGKKIRSIAPVSGIEFNDSIINDDIRFIKPTIQDLQNVEMIKWNKKDHFDFDMFYDNRAPLLIVEYEFEWNPNPYDYSVAKNFERLNATSRSKFDTLLSVCRLVVEHPERVGIGIMFHMDPCWTTYSSARPITEDPSPNFRPLQIDGRPMERDESYYPLEEVHKDELQGLLSKVITARNLVLQQSTGDSPYVDLLLAVKTYSKFAEEYDPDWILLDLVKCLESLGNFHNSSKANPTRCDSDGSSIRALNINDSQEKAVIRKAFKVRSMRAAHSLKDIPIEPTLVENLRKLDRKLILNSLGTIVP